MWYKNIYGLLTVVFVVFGLIGCKKDKTEACEIEGCIPGSVSYQQDIVPIITNSCATNLGPGTGCHDAWIFDYNNVKGNMDNGLIMSVINDGSMPQIPNSFGIDSLTEQEIFLFQCWACSGAPNN